MGPSEALPPGQGPAQGPPPPASQSLSITHTHTLIRSQFFRPFGSVQRLSGRAIGTRPCPPLTCPPVQPSGWDPGLSGAVAPGVQGLCSRPVELDSGALKHCQPLVLLCYFSFGGGGRLEVFSAVFLLPRPSEEGRRESGQREGGGLPRLHIACFWLCIVRYQACLHR